MSAGTFRLAARALAVHFTASAGNSPVRALALPKCRDDVRRTSFSSYPYPNRGETIGRFLAGAAKGPDGKRVPNLTPAKLKKWDDAELKDFLLTGLTPNGDVAAETMGEVIRNSTSQSTPDDLAALIAYPRALSPLPDETD